MIMEDPHVAHEEQVVHAAHPGGALQVIVPLEEFAEDLELRLGRANGNIYHRREGIEGLHDGQVMVRLKKKRFIIIDYSILPTDEDIQAAQATPHVSVPTGAGKQKCATPECPKVGVPVLLYDSEPNEPSSLYMRSGLCFTCQRNLNEKRRTQRKRPGDTSGSSVLYAVGPGSKKVKLNGATMELNPEAIILNGPPLGGAKSVGDGYSFDEIGPDLAHCVRQATNDTDRLINSISGTATTTPATSAEAPHHLSHIHHHHNPHHHHHDHNPHQHPHHHHSSDLPVVSVEEAANAAVEASTSLLNGAGPPPPPAASSEDINDLYDKAFHSLSKSIYLLSQWKQSWDAAIAAAVAQETVNDPSLADAVASAAAVVAAAADGSEAASTTNMVSLLLAADQRKEHPHDAKVVIPEGDNVQAFEV